MALPTSSGAAAIDIDRAGVPAGCRDPTMAEDILALVAAIVLSCTPLRIIGSAQELHVRRIVRGSGCGPVKVSQAIASTTAVAGRAIQRVYRQGIVFAMFAGTVRTIGEYCCV